MQFDNLEAKFTKFMFKVSMGQRRRLWLKLSKLISNGVPILKAIDDMYTRRVNAGSIKHQTTIALREWATDMRNGTRLSESLNGWVGDDERLLIGAGEQAGTIDESLLAAARLMKAKSEIRGAILGGLIYPIVLFAMAIGLVYLFGYKIIPAFGRVAPEDQWTGIGHTMIVSSHFIQDWLLPIVVFVLVLIVLFFYSLPRWTKTAPKMRIVLDRYVPYSVYRVQVGSTWLLGFAALIEAGMRVENALEHIAANANPWLKDRVQACLRGTRSGKNIGDALATSGYEFPDREIIDDLGVYSQLSGFDAALAILGNEWLTESVDEIKSRMAGVFAALIVVVGVLVIFFVLGLISMQLQMTTLVQGHYR